MKSRWSIEEDAILSQNYQLVKQELLKLLPNRTASAINIRASMLGLRKNQNEYKRSDLSFLMEDSNISYYWIGFIMADGCFSGPGLNRLLISLAAKDSYHLNEFAKLIKTKTILNTKNIKYPKISMSCQDKYYCPLIREKFDFKISKTYNPPTKLPTTNKNLLLSMLCGLIDGDGNIGKQHNRNKHRIRIKCHSSWKHFYELLNDSIFNFSNPSKINNQGYYSYSIYKQSTIRYILEEVSKLNIPLLERKWKPIYEEYQIST